MGLFSKDSKKTSTSEIPSWLESGSKTAVSMATDLAKTPYESNVKGTADFNADQLSVFDQLKKMLAGGADPTGGLTAAATAGPQQISTERVVDENGKLGAISDYMNPYVENALTPALRKIQEQADATRKQIGAGAQSASAFGDARHGILESTLDRNTSQSIGDTASTFLKNAFDTVMGQRNTDLNRFGDVDKTNANAAETALNRQSQGAKDMQTQLLNQLQAALAGGNQQQGQEQAKLDATYADKAAGQNYKFDVLQALTSALSGVPYSKTTTQTEPDNSGLQLAGAIGGQALSTFGPALAALI